MSLKFSILYPDSNICTVSLCIHNAILFHCHSPDHVFFHPQAFVHIVVCLEQPSFPILIFFNVLLYNSCHPDITYPWRPS